MSKEHDTIVKRVLDLEKAKEDLAVAIIREVMPIFQKLRELSKKPIRLKGSKK